MIRERVAKLQKEMKRQGVDYYVVPTDDFHGSEYVGEHFKCRQFITGFTGSAGTAVVWKDGAGLWTDGRYFLQAGEQLKGSGITLFKMGEEGIPTIFEFLKERMEKGQCVGMDGRTVSASWMKSLSDILEQKEVRIRYNLDLIGDIWENRPQRSCEPVWMLPDETDRGCSYKLERIRSDMEKEGTQLLVLSSLDEIAWLLNIRGNDTAYCPVALAYAVVSMRETILYLQSEAVTDKVRAYLEAENVQLRGYEQIYEQIASMAEGKKVWADAEQVNAALAAELKGAAHILEKESSILKRKAIKSEAQLAKIKEAHRKDGAAVTKFLYWLKQHVGKERITETGAAEKLEEFRKQQKGYLMPSFEPIMAYREHGAIVHYSANEDTEFELLSKNLLLMDTGAHYLEGTTDITRTVALGTPDAQRRRNYTMVLKGNLRLAAAKFLYGCSGENLDILARQPLWEAGLDYNHGTGHGVGFLLSVHEGPQAIRWRHTKGKEPVVLEEGMVVSDEPGLYLQGQYGIRLENLLACVKKEKTVYGQFMGFEVMTLVPFDKDAMEPELLDPFERKLLNDYHRAVYDALAPHLTAREAAWLQGATEVL